MAIHPHLKFALNLCLALAAIAPTASGQAAPQTQAADRQSALALERAGDVSAAEAAWRALSSRNPRDPEPYAHLALLEARADHYNEAIALYRKALALSPNMPSLRLNLGLALFKSGNLREAIPQFTLARRGTPAGSPEAERLDILLGMAHYGLAQYAQAAPFLRAAAARDAQNLPLRLALAHSCLWSKQYQCVLDTYHQILELNAESAEADMLAGEALDEMKDSAGAITQFRAAVKAGPNEPNVHFGLGYLLWKGKQYEEAAAEFRAELAGDPRHAQALLYLGDSELEQNKPDLARPHIEKALALDSSLWRAHLDLGILDADAGKNGDALREFEAAEKMNPAEVNVHWRLGRLYRAMGRRAESEAEFAKAKTLTTAADEDLFHKMGRPQASAGDAAEPQR